MKAVLFIFILFTQFGCKQHRDVDIKGIATDFYTKEPIVGVKIRLFSQIESGVSGGTRKDYFTHTDSKGQYYFHNAYFSKPAFNGDVQIYDNESGTYLTMKDGYIQKSDVRLIGKTKLIRDLQAICLGTVNISVNLLKTYDWTDYDINTSFFSPMGPNTEMEVKGMAKFIRVSNQAFNLATPILGYKNGITVIHLSLLDKNDKIIVSKSDTLLARGCGKIFDYTMTIN